MSGSQIKNWVRPNGGERKKNHNKNGGRDIERYPQTPRAITEGRRIKKRKKKYLGYEPLPISNMWGD